MEDRLYRSRNDRILAGVAGGLADQWDADPSLVRLVWALLVVFTGGIALLVYVIMAIVVPEEPVAFTSPVVPAAPGAPTNPGASPDVAPPVAPLYATPTPYGLVPTRAERRAVRRASRHERRRGRDGEAVVVVGGVFLILLGAFFLVRQWLPQLDFDWFWPMILIAIGVAIVVAAAGRGTELSGPPSDPYDAPPVEPPVRGTTEPGPNEPRPI